MVRLMGFLIVLALALSIPWTASADETVKEKLLERIGKALGKDLDLVSGPPGKIERAARVRSQEDVEAAKALASKRYALDDWDLTIRDSLELLAETAGVRIDLSEGLSEISGEKGTVTGTKISGASFSQAVKAIGKAAEIDLAWRIQGGVVHVQTDDEREEEREARLEMLRDLIEEVAGEDARFLGERYLLVYVEPQDDSQEARRIREILAMRKITLNFEETPLDHVVSFIRDITETNIVMSKDVQEMARDLTVTLKVSNIRLENALNLILDGTGEDLEWTVKHDVLYIRTPEEREKDRPDRTFVLIDISDILFVPPDFPAPKLGVGKLDRDQ